MSFSPESAETLALQALAWLSGNDELMPIFMGSTGVSVDDLKTQAGDPAFLASVLDFIIMDDQWVIAFCDAQNLEYTAPMMARQVLPGGEQVNWT
ncbi:DUF3572 domain-containing protein [Cognatishimia activa]|uniref:DUF3572 domain-containing protein n=1 Tax=Cognatishimia activa TaxID=1715691 RepID=A0A0P1IQB7_9RHOB|nr:DUF3572 domain-containing protein [Cognatishimia activa]MEE2945897.1 DUF3572 domain-containing protein [Pseudomonadota bacterium]CUI90134.1 hypothetical protein TA5113_01754 [Cognatishimia activa]CUK25691.1 hypothetical protein TA5114_01493 [Cognatishimia activa]